MKKEMVICDICKDKLAINVCDICKQDVCSYDYRVLDLAFDKNFQMAKLNLCKTCLNSLNMVNPPEVKEALIEILKKRIVSYKLK